MLWKAVRWGFRQLVSLTMEGSSILSGIQALPPKRISRHRVVLSSGWRIINCMNLLIAVRKSGQVFLWQSGCLSIHSGGCIALRDTARAHSAVCPGMVSSPLLDCPVSDKPLPLEQREPWAVRGAQCAQLNNVREAERIGLSGLWCQNICLAHRNPADYPGMVDRVAYISMHPCIENQTGCNEFTEETRLTYLDEKSGKHPPFDDASPILWNMRT